MDELIDYFLSAIENDTRREILRMLTMDPSYALEMSRRTGISQQAINKQLYFLEKAGLITLEGVISNNSGPPRRVYRPTNFRTLVFDYSPNFVRVKMYDILPEQSDNENPDRINEKSSISKLREIDQRIDNIMNERGTLLRERNAVISSLQAEINRIYNDPISREVALRYIDSLNTEDVARKTGIPRNLVEAIVGRIDP